jgi:hypothetical protein
MFSKEKYRFILKKNIRTLNIIDKPGTGKSSIIKEIGEEEKWRYLPIYISNDDYTDIGGFPDKTYSQKFKVKVLKKAIPEWALIANEKPSIVVFEEWNRAPMENINAIFPIILERRIGYSFFFKPYVRFAMTGNLGGKLDGCDVNEFDKATKGRLMTIKHKLTLEEWDTNFAEKNINIFIRKFLSLKKEFFYKIGENDDWNYASPRSWEAISNYIGKENNDLNSIIKIVELIGEDTIGSTAFHFLRYLSETNKITIYDIISNYKTIIKKIDRAKVSELLKELENVNMDQINISNFDNINMFLKDIDSDERLSYIKYIQDKILVNVMQQDNIVIKPYLENLGKNFRKDFEKISGISDISEKDQDSFNKPF